MLQKGFLVYLEIAFDQCETNLVYFWYTTKSYNDNLMLEKWFKLNDLIITQGIVFKQTLKLYTVFPLVL
jgi:hypothetical protein